jgi:hypothetical protein
VTETRKNSWAEYVECMGARSNAYKIVREPNGKSLLGIPRNRWEDSIRLDVREIGQKGFDWIYAA